MELKSDDLVQLKSKDAIPALCRCVKMFHQVALCLSQQNYTLNERNDYHALAAYYLVIEDSLSSSAPYIYPHSPPILQLWDCLESLLRVPTDHEHPRKSVLDEGWMSSSTWSAYLLWEKQSIGSSFHRQQDFTHQYMTVHVLDGLQRSNLLEFLDHWTKQFRRRYPSSIESVRTRAVELASEDVTELSSSNLYQGDFSTAAAQLFEALAAASNCGCHTAQQVSARLRLETRWQDNFSDFNASYAQDTYTEFDLFISKDCFWHEVHAFSVMTAVQMMEARSAKQNWSSGGGWNCANDSSPKPERMSTSKTNNFRDLFSRALPFRNKVKYSSSSDPKGMRVRALCQPLEKSKKHPLDRLMLLIESGKLWKLQSERVTMLIDRRKTAVSLEHILSKQQTCLTEKIKRILAVLLSHAVLQLAQTPWLDCGHMSANIVFLPTAGLTVPVTPFVHVTLGSPAAVKTGSNSISHRWRNKSNIDKKRKVREKEDEDPDEFRAYHPYRQLVNLAAILLEVWFARTLNALAGAYNIWPIGDDANTDLSQDTGSQDDFDDRYLLLLEVFQACKPDIPMMSCFGNVIDACLNHRLWEDSNGCPLLDREANHATLRSRVYTHVVSPLELELTAAFRDTSIEKLDRIAMSLDLSKWGRIEASSDEQNSRDLAKSPIPSNINRDVVSNVPEEAKKSSARKGKQRAVEDITEFRNFGRLGIQATHQNIHGNFYYNVKNSS